MALEDRIKRLEKAVCPTGTIIVPCGLHGEPLPCYCGKTLKLEDCVPPNFKGTVICVINSYYPREKETLPPPCRCKAEFAFSKRSEKTASTPVQTVPQFAFACRPSSVTSTCGFDRSLLTPRTYHPPERASRRVSYGPPQQLGR